MLIALVPAYNEEKNIGSVVRSLFRIVDNVVVIDDGSHDLTAQISRESGAIVLRHVINRGQGAALQTGHEFAKQINADFVVHFDGDDQFRAEEINGAILKMQQENADILFGSRFLEKKSNIPFLKRNLILPTARFVSRIFGGASLRDAHNGFRILNRRALEEIVITQDRMAHATEIPALVKEKGLVFVEYPISVVYKDYGQNFFGGLKIVFDLILAKFVK